MIDNAHKKHPLTKQQQQVHCTGFFGAGGWVGGWIYIFAQAQCKKFSDLSMRTHTHTHTHTKARGWGGGGGGGE